MGEGIPSCLTRTDEVQRASSTPLGLESFSPGLMTFAFVQCQELAASAKLYTHMISVYIYIYIFFFAEALDIKKIKHCMY